MPKYTFINPHDDYTFDAPDDDVASTMVLLIGPMYGWQEGGRTDIPGFHDPDSDVGKALLATAKAVVSERTAEVVAALRSLEIKADQRGEEDPEVWHDKVRTSVFDPRAEARRVADILAV